MMKPLIWSALVVLCLGSGFCEGACGRESVEDLESACGYPGALILTSSPNGKKLDAKNCDAEFDKAEWQEPPLAAFPDARPDKTYVLICVDPDPPGYEKGQYWLHWLVSGIKGEDFARGDLSGARQLWDYYGPAPPAGSGLHRYMFLAFEEEDRNVGVEKPGSRSKFDLGAWLRRNPNLCGPMAGIQFRTQF